MIKPIETRYNGYRFRSRLEARWAVFFDHLGIKYEYEKEGFELPSGRYLPDFWLPQYNAWFEVKGEEPDEYELRLAQELFDNEFSPVFIATGMPHEGRGVCFASLDGEMISENFWFSVCQGAPRIVVGDKTDCHWLDGIITNKVGIYAGDADMIIPATDRGYFDVATNKDWRMEKAASDAAKQARFEHGEYGR